ncbi:MAG: dimethyladenosine transferase [Candidatus Saccharibacteria bacterium]|nr:dimethyladenosine transferase [Candidatus Saccharibacteria bacterium]
MAKNKTTRKRTSKRQPKRYKLPVVYAAIALLVIVLAGYLILVNQASKTGRLVTFHDRGQNHVILTQAASVSDALKDAQISVAPQDVVEPAVGSDLLSTDSVVIIYRARPVLVVDGALRQKVITPAQSPNEIAVAAGMSAINDKDKANIKEASIIADGASEVLTIERAVPPVNPLANLLKPTASALSVNKGAQIYVDSSGVAHRETYYDLPMNIVINACGAGNYTIRYDGAKIDKDGYVLVAAGFGAYPRCSVVETSLGLGKVYDTGGFALRYPHGFDLATDWSNYNGR